MKNDISVNSNSINITYFINKNHFGVISYCVVKFTIEEKHSHKLKPKIFTIFTKRCKFEKEAQRYVEDIGREIINEIKGNFNPDLTLGEAKVLVENKILKKERG